METMNHAAKQRLYRAGVILTGVLATGAYLQFLWQVQRWGYFAVSAKWAAGMAGLAAGVLLLWGIVALLAKQWAERGMLWLERLPKRLQRYGGWGWVGFAALMSLFAWLLMGPAAKYLAQLLPRLLVLWLAGLAGVICLTAGLPRQSLAVRGMLSGLGLALAYRIALFFPQINSFPFSLTWSEATQYYYASLFLAKRFYGEALPLPLFNPARALLELPPLLLPQPSILLSRLWEALLWLGITYLGAWRLTERVNPVRTTGGALFLLGAWVYLFEAQVYYHLLLAAAVVLWLFDVHKPGRTLVVVALASVWTGLCRLNWYPMPALIAITLYLLEQPRGRLTFWRYTRWLFAWGVVGMAAALGTITLYTALSGRGESHALTSLRSELLWGRLLPNPTYPPGILLAALLFGLPAILLIFLFLQARGKTIGMLRLAGLGGILMLLFAGGILVSLKIGGGSNLHNMDAFWLILLVIVAHILFGRVEPETESTKWAAPAWVIALLALIPIISLLTGGAPRTELPRERATQALQEIRARVQAANTTGKPVLFITERQLFPFGEVQGTRLRPEYEIIELMEMIMAGNTTYTDQFRADLKAQTYALIVTDVEYNQLKGLETPFAEENNLYVLRAGKHIACYYEAVGTYEDVGVQLFTPREEDCE